MENGSIRQVDAKVVCSARLNGRREAGGLKRGIFRRQSAALDLLAAPQRLLLRVAQFGDRLRSERGHTHLVLSHDCPISLGHSRELELARLIGRTYCGPRRGQPHERRPPSEELDEIEDFDHGMEMIAVADAVEAGLEQLHAADREAVALYYLEELSVAEVAEICGVPPGTIKSRLHRARQIIFQTLTRGAHDERN